MPQGLQLLLPSSFPGAVVREIAEYAGWKCPYVGRMVRLSLLGTLHDAFVVDEARDVVVLLVKCGGRT